MTDKLHGNSASPPDLTSELRQALEIEVAGKRAAKLPDATDLVKDWCFHNTKKLLQKYRSTKMAVSAALMELENECLDELGTRFDNVAELSRYLDIDLSGTYLESRLRVMEQNRQMLTIIDRAINSMRIYDLNGEEFYWILYFKYMSPGEEIGLKDTEVVDRLVEKGLVVSHSTYYRRHNAAIRTLGDLLWGYTGRDTIELAEIII